MGDSPRIVATPFHRAEVANAFYRSVFRSTLNEFDAARAWKLFESDLGAGVFEWSDLNDATWELTVRLAQRFCGQLGVRTLDTLHVACALGLRAERFWTFDERQKKLAEVVGLNTGV